MTEREAIKLSIAHWERMVKWSADKNNKRGRRYNKYHECKYVTAMLAEIGEAPTSRHCALCGEYEHTCFGKPCRGCPLGEKYGSCYETNKNAYMKAHLSESWPEFVKHGKRLIKQLESLVN